MILTIIIVTAAIKLSSIVGMLTLDKFITREEILTC